MVNKNLINEFDDKEAIWKRPGIDYCVEISHKKENQGCWVNIWSVCAHIYPNHPYFEKSKKINSISYDTKALYFYNGISFAKKYYNDNMEIISVQIGCDYAHYLKDQYYRAMERPEDVLYVFRDAKKLWFQLDGMITGDRSVYDDY